MKLEDMYKIAIESISQEKLKEFIAFDVPENVVVGGVPSKIIKKIEL